MENKFIGYDYTEMTVDKSRVPRYIDSYACFGWRLDDDTKTDEGMGGVTLKFKRDRKIMNKAELTRLTRNFDACMSEIDALEKSKKSVPAAAALTAGLIGTAFIAGSTFAATAEPPVIWLCVLLAIPGFICWTAPYFLYKRVLQRRTEKLEPLIEAKYDEIYTLCEKGNALL